VMNYIKESTGAEIEPLWSEGGENGLNKDLPITLSVKNVPALDVIERLLAKSQTEFSENTWQLTQNGAIEMGPKELLNKHKRLELYDINDLLFQIPNYTDVPEIDLQGLLQQSQGGGGAQSPIREEQQQQRRTPEQEKQRRKDAVQEVLALIIALVEPQQWVDNGG